MIPKSLDEAAMIDGAGSLKVFYHVAIRLSISTILVVFLFSFVFNWNETYTTNILTGDALELLPGRLSLFDNGSTSNAVSELNRSHQDGSYTYSNCTIVSIVRMRTETVHRRYRKYRYHR